MAIHFCCMEKRSLDILLNKIFYLPLNGKQKKLTGFGRRCENDDNIFISYSYNKAVDWIYHEFLWTLRECFSPYIPKLLRSYCNEEW